MKDSMSKSNCFLLTLWQTYSFTKSKIKKLITESVCMLLFIIKLLNAA